MESNVSRRLSLFWTSALRDLKDDRSKPAPVREERLRSVSAVGCVSLTAWRGHSGRRYVSTIHTLSDVRFDEIGEAVVIAVRRPEVGAAAVIDVAVSAAVAEPALWVRAAEADGANEIHIHRLASTPSERRAAVLDLQSEAA